METGRPATDEEQRVAVIRREVTPQMIANGRAAFDAWMDKWDYLEGGLPHQADVDQLLLSIFSAMRCEQEPSADTT